MDNFIKELRGEGIAFLENQSMASHTSFRLGGAARVFVMPRTVGELSLAVLLCEEFKVEYFVVGNGTNLIVRDGGYSGAIISTLHMEKILEKRENEARVSAGVLMFEFHKFLKDSSLKGLEWAYGIPGSVGGAVYMNAGAYGSDISMFIKEVLVLKNRKTMRLSREEIDFSYRNSNLNGFIILEATFLLEEGDFYEISGRQTEYFGRRRDKQPLEFPSAGSVFKREGDVLPAILIDKLGLKGVKIGNAEVSKKHAGFIVNLGGATATDVINLIELVQSRVLKEAGVSLKTEVIIIGD